MCSYAHNNCLGRRPIVDEKAGDYVWETVESPSTYSVRDCFDGQPVASGSPPCWCPGLLTPKKNHGINESIKLQYDSVWRDVVNIGLGLKDLCKLDSDASGESQTRLGDSQKTSMDHAIPPSSTSMRYRPHEVDDIEGESGQCTASKLQEKGTRKF